MKLTVGSARAQKVISQPSGMARCAGEAVLWSRAEAEHRRATSTADARDATAPALEMCVGCPLMRSGECHEIASAEKYSGLAAGAVYVNGRRRRPDHVLGRAEQAEDLLDQVRVG